MSKEACYHCGDLLHVKPIFYDDKEFCCDGCKGVYAILKDNNLGNYYTLDKEAGIKPKSINYRKYEFLNVPSIQQKFIDFKDEKSSRVTLFLPKIHCSSCIFLLENLNRIDAAVLSSQVNFTKREATIVFDHNKITFEKLALLLENIGYPPNFGNKREEDKKAQRSALYKLGIAGFAFGSIMLWSFPEYLGIENEHAEFRNFTSVLSFLISIPVLFYSASDYFISAFKALKNKSLNLDVPITIGIVALYLQSITSIFMEDGPGYMDSFAGFIFFLLIGKSFQSMTYKSLSFERDYSSYFPVAITRITENGDEIIEIEDLKIGDEIHVRNEEVIPCDCILISEIAIIDYSFVTGESDAITKLNGDFIFAGGKLLGQQIKLKVTKESQRSHLTQLWNEVKSSKETSSNYKYQDKLSIYFLIGLLIVATIASIGWAFYDVYEIPKVLVAILIVACPCALALSAPFTYGNIIRFLGREGLYLKNSQVIERLNKVTDIVFDKTGTLTQSDVEDVTYEGYTLDQELIDAIYALTNSSTHPLSIKITHFLKEQKSKQHSIENFQEIKGKGIEGIIGEIYIHLGKASYAYSDETNSSESTVYLSVNKIPFGKFIIHAHLREGITEMIRSLQKYNLHLLSGDHKTDSETMHSLFGRDAHIFFKQSPRQKFEYVQLLQEQGKKVLMIGDGLNDSGALGKADIGIAVSEDIFRFTPSSDAIIEANSLRKLNNLLKLSEKSKVVLRLCLGFSLFYNLIGLVFAISGQLTPLVAAILMPISSITVVIISTLSVFIFSKLLHDKKHDRNQFFG
jgi:Cu+-exporting ATPase